MKWAYSLALCSAFLSVFCLPCYSNSLAIERLRATTVHIAIGSGSIVEGRSGRHYLLTNQHVCNSGSWKGKMRASYESGFLVSGPIVKKSWTSDLCATRVDKMPNALKVGKRLDPGEQLYTRGYPFGVLSESHGQFVGTASWQYTYPIEETGECFKGSTKKYDGSNRIMGCNVTYFDNVTNMYSRPGSSGSPVVNEAGELVGVMSSWMSDQDAGGMVPLERVQEFMRDL